MKIAIRRLREILLYSDLEFSELVTSLAALNWGLWLLMPWVSMDMPGRPGMRALVEMAPAEVWAFATILLGSLQALALARDLKRIRSWVSAAAFFLWVSMSILFIAIDFSSPHVPLYGIYALAAGWAHLRVAVLRFHDPRLAAADRCSDL